MQNVDQAGLDQLCYRQGRGDPDERFVRKAYCAFRNSVDVTGETESGEVVEEITSKATGAFEPVNVVRRKAQRLEIGEGVLEAGCDQKIASRRQPPHEEFEHGLIVLAAIQICLDHVEFVKVGREGVR